MAGPRRRVHLRGPDAELPRRRGHQRPPAGGALAAVLVGPWAGAICVARRAAGPGAAVRRRRSDRARTQRPQHGVRSPAWGGYAMFVGDPPRAARPRAASVVAASGRRRALGRDLASLAFVVEYALGGTGGASVAHGVRGDGRRALPDRDRRGHHHRAHGGRRPGVRPDLVYGAHDLLPSSRCDAGWLVAEVVRWRSSERDRALFIVGGLLVALGLAFFVSPLREQLARRPEQGRDRRGLRRRASRARARRQPARRLRRRGRRRRVAVHGARGHHRASRSRSASAC